MMEEDVPPSWLPLDNVYKYYFQESIATYKLRAITEKYTNDVFITCYLHEM